MEADRPRQYCRKTTGMVYNRQASDIAAKNGGNIKPLLENISGSIRGNGAGSLESAGTLRHRLLSLCFLVIIALGICWFNYRLHFNGFIRNDNHDYCQIARNFYDGNGYSTSALRPLAYKYFDTLPQPEAIRMPVYPLMLSLMFRIFGPNDFSVVLFNSFFYVLLITLVYLIAFEVSTDNFISLVAALVTAFMEAFLRDAITAEPNIFYTAMFCGFLYFYLSYPRMTMVHGIMLGLLHLIRPSTLFVFMAFWIVVFFSKLAWKQRLSTLFYLTSGFIIGLVPYMIRNYSIAGKPFFSLANYSMLLLTKSFPSYTIWTMVPSIDPSAFVRSHLSEILIKCAQSLNFLFDDFLSYYKALVLFIFLLGFLLPVNRERLKPVKAVISVWFLVQTLLLLPVTPVAYYYLFFFPMIIIIGLTSAQTYFAKYAHVLAVCILIFVISTTMAYWKSPKTQNPFISIGTQVAALTSEKDIILTDVPWEIAWYANRRSIWLTYDTETLNMISRTLKPRYILLTGRFYAPYKDGLWQNILYNPDNAKNIGYEKSSVIMFNNSPVAILYKAVQ
jgi:4-amino-4-deoxy-L-arabinose transferase-like glycosyltransferase